MKSWRHTRHLTPVQGRAAGRDGGDRRMLRRAFDAMTNDRDYMADADKPQS